MFSAKVDRNGYAGKRTIPRTGVELFGKELTGRFLQLTRLGNTTRFSGTLGTVSCRPRQGKS